MKQPETFPQVVGVLDTNDHAALALATTALRDAEIVFDVVAIADVPANPDGPEPTWWRPPTRILVSVEDASEARALLEPFQKPQPLSELRPDLATKSEKPRWVPLVQKLGTWVICSVFALAGILFMVGAIRKRDPIGLIVSGLFLIGLPRIFLKILSKMSR